MSLETFGDLNWLAVLVGAVAFFALGALWYSAILFAKPWLRATGRTQEEISGPGVGYAISFLGYLVMAIALAFIARSTAASSIGDGIVLGLIAGLGFVTPIFVIGQIFEDRPTALTLINAGYNVLGLVVTGIIVTSWD